MNGLKERLMGVLSSPEVVRIANEQLARAKALGMVSDWAAALEKEEDFARLVVAVQRVFPPGGSIETGVLRGGTSALLIQSCAPESFHVSIDPFGLRRAVVRAPPGTGMGGGARHDAAPAYAGRGVQSHLCPLPDGLAHVHTV